MEKQLFTPISIHDVAIRNRVVMSPMTRAQSPGGVPTEHVASYYAARARGGVGLIITEAIAVNRPHAANSTSIPNFNNEEAIIGWKKVVGGVHAAGAKIFAQLWHCGEQQRNDPIYTEGLPFEGPENMSEVDIDQTIAQFGAAAAIAKQIGFDGVELHGANGYLIDQFLWAKTNQRKDKWGGTAKNRTQFAIELVRAVRRNTDAGFPISFRFSQFKLSDYSAKLAETPEELANILVPLADAGVDIFHASQRRFWEPEFPGSTLNLAGWAKKLTGKLATTVGSVGLTGPDTGDLLAHKGGSAPVGGIEEVEKRLSLGEFDFVAVGRALLTDSHWANKIRDGRTAELKGFDVQSLFSLVDA